MKSINRTKFAECLAESRFRLSLRKLHRQSKGLVESVRLVIAALTIDLRPELSAKDPEQRSLSLVADHVLPGGLLNERRIENSFQVNGQELVGVSLLANAIPVPDGRQGFHN